MKTANLFIFSLAVIIVAASLAGCSKSTGDQPADAPEKTEAKAGVTIDAATQERIGLKTEFPTATQWQPEIKAYGHVLDTAPLVDLLMDLGRAEMTFDSSHRELERAKQLKQDNNISERVFQEAETTYQQNFGAATAAYFKIKTVWGGKIAELTGPIMVPPGTPRKPSAVLDDIAMANSLIRVDWPAGEQSSAVGTTRIVPLEKTGRPITASFFDKLPTMDPQTQQQGFLFINDAPHTADRLTPGEAVTAFIKTSGAAIKGVVVPASAVLRHEGKGWVYVQAETNQFIRVEVPLERLTGDGGFFSETLSATNRIVVSGAQTVLSAELGGGFTTGARD